LRWSLVVGFPRRSGKTFKPQKKCVLMQVSALSNKPIRCHCVMGIQQLRTTSDNIVKLNANFSNRMTVVKHKNDKKTCEPQFRMQCKTCAALIGYRS
jgi:hypothetical protein